MQLQRERGGCRSSAGLSETLSTVEKVSQVEELTRGVRAGHQRRLPLVSSTIRRRALPLRGGSALGPRVKLVRCEYTRTPRSHVRNTLQIKLTIANQVDYCSTQHGRVFHRPAVAAGAPDIAGRSRAAPKVVWATCVPATATAAAPKVVWATCGPATATAAAGGGGAWGAARSRRAEAAASTSTCVRGTWPCLFASLPTNHLRTPLPRASHSAHPPPAH